ncbi:hypothetical protein BJY24_003679 [Nocardia transvalensis]|uniref:Uncharacterized protein n=1 Tax=Nocardia transvalensis TaxID=37333 RepID=A0A7W9PET4_9NOCA|nr:hypothetical protein [Nocardia transvalensis]MBB5914812.1 hypothetical protein [Nocardia transvalensis]
MATTSLPLATAAAVATILTASPAATAAPVEPAVPTTPAQPGTNEVQSPEGQQAPSTQPQEPQSPSQPGATSPQPGVTTPQPGVTTPDPNAPKPDPNAPKPDEKSPNRTQPGVTTPRVAPLPVPGQEVQPPVTPGQPDGGQTDQLKPQQPHPDQPQVTPRPAQPGQGGQGGQGTGQGGTDNLTGNGPSQDSTQPRWNAPSLQSAPAAPVVPMQGPHTEVGANIDAGGVMPGYVANTHHFSNLDGYVGTVGYSTPTGTGDGGVSLEFVEANKIKVTTYTHTTGIDDLKSATGFNDITNESYVDTTQANAAKAAVEGWIRMQPGGEAALQAAGQVGKLPEGELAPQTVDVAGITTQWSGSVQN